MSLDELLIRTLTEKIRSKTSRIGIVGLGYVGIPLSQRFLEAGFEVIGFDVDTDRIRLLASGKKIFAHIDPKPIKKFIADDKFKIYVDSDNLSYCDAVLICVPTPLTKNRDPDLHFVEEACADVSRILRRGQIIILESTTYPGTTEEIVKKILETNINEFKTGQDFFLAFSPEREDPGNKDFSLKNTPKIVGGCTQTCLELAVLLYSQITNEVVPVSSCAAAEMTKILENTYRAVNIALVNELKVICHRMNIDIWEVIKAASTKPYGFQPFYPSVGTGGHCIYVDPHYLSWKAKQTETPTRFIDLAGEINWEMPRYVTYRIQEALNKNGMAVKGANILVLGVAYKKNIGDTRESSAIKVIERLIDLGANISYSDPFVNYLDKLKLEHTIITKEVIQNQDCIVCAVDHSGVNYALIAEFAKLIVDTKNVFGRKNNVIPA